MITLDASEVTVDQNGRVTNSGTFQDVLADTVTLAASIGTIVDNGDGTWSWSLDTTNPGSAIPGSATVTVTATDSDVATSSATFVATDEEDSGPTIDALVTDATFEDKAGENEAVTLSGAFSGSSLDTHSVRIDWGDGTVVTTGVDELAGTFGAEHVYGQGGVFKVTVTLSDDDGLSTVASIESVVSGVGSVDGVLQIVGTNRNDRINIRRAGNRLAVWTDINRGWRFFDSSSISEIKVLACEGNDRVWTSSRCLWAEWQRLCRWGIGARLCLRWRWLGYRARRQRCRRALRFQWA